METLQYPKEVTANKEHRCDFCIEKILKGEKYNTSTHKSDGRVYTWKSHIKCGEIASRLNMYEDCDEGLDGDTFQEIISNEHYTLLQSKVPKELYTDLSDILIQLRYVRFKEKLNYVIRHYNKIDKEKVDKQVNN